MKNIVNLLVGGIGCFAVVDIMPMMLAKKRQVVPSIGIRKCSQDQVFQKNKQRIGDEMIELRAELWRIEQELNDQFNFLQERYELSVSLRKRLEVLEEKNNNGENQ